MEIRLTEHARERAGARGATLDEIRQVLSIERGMGAKEGRKSKEMVLEYNREWLGKHYPQKKVKVFYTEEDDTIVVITVKVFFGKWG